MTHPSTCKYHTGSKKLLQTKNRFWSFRRRFLYVTEVADAVFFVKKGFLAIQMEYFWKARKPFCFAKRLLLQCKWGPSEVLKLPFWRAKVVLLKRKGAFFESLELHSCARERYNSLSTSMIIVARAKLKNFEQKASLCCQMAVLSGLKCKYRSEAQLAPVEKVRCWWGVVCQLNYHHYTQ